MEDFVAICKERTTEALESFLRVLRFVPADKLTWSPTPTAKSALQIVAHCAGYSGNFAAIISTRKFPPVDEFRGAVKAAIASVTTLEEAEAMLRKGIADTIVALDTVKPEEVRGMIDAPQGPTPFMFFLTLPAGHLETHESQIDYLQTCWDDQEVHI